MPDGVSVVVLLLVVAVAAWSQAPDLGGREPPAGGVWVDSLDLGKVSQEWGTAHAGQSVEGKPLTLNGVAYAHGLGTHARSEFDIDLKRGAVRFDAAVGVDDERKGSGSVVFEVWVDDRQRAVTPVMHGGDMARRISVDLRGARYLGLVVGDAGDGINDDHADWAGAVIIVSPEAKEKPAAATPPVEPAPRIASSRSPRPAIHGPRVVGATPGRPFLFLIPATGQGPLTYAASNLPPGLVLDPRTGIITGSLKQAGTTLATLLVRGPQGAATRGLQIVGGTHKLALTPPMGWNSWYVWGGSVTDQKVREAAGTMISTGLAAHGYQYINIDDTWEGSRNPAGEIQPNTRFPDMKTLADYVHRKGLKLGIYSSPGPKTCGGFEGSFGHEQQDASTYAQWGIDFLKYDWCSYGEVAKDASRAEFQKPYRVMRAALDRCDRDIVYSLCQYGMGDVWEWGAQVGANLWRTTGDIWHRWGQMSSIGFNQARYQAYAGPGHWNDPDMLMAGRLGGGPTELTPAEQVTQFTLWSLAAAPLLLSCDLAQLDNFTLDLVTNDEVIEVNQDPLGRAAGLRARHGWHEVWARPLADGTTAVGLFNRGYLRARVTARWTDLGLKGRLPVRDLWQQKDLGYFQDSFTASVPAHGAVLVKIGRPRRP